MDRENLVTRSLGFSETGRKPLELLEVSPLPSKTRRTRLCRKTPCAASLPDHASNGCSSEVKTRHWVRSGLGVARAAPSCGDHGRKEPYGLSFLEATIRLSGREMNTEETESRMGNTSSNGSPRTVIRDLTAKLARMDSLLERREERMHLEWEQFVSLASFETLLKALKYLRRLENSMFRDLLLIGDWLDGRPLRGAVARRGRQRRRAIRSSPTASPRAVSPLGG